MDASHHPITATARRRQRQIEECLYQNMLRVPYAAISVSDLCRQVGISRKAFYNYYHDKDECFASVVDWFIRDAMLHVATHIPDNASPLEGAIILLEYWRDHKTFFDVVVSNNLMHFLFIQNMRYVLEEDRATMEMLNTPDVKSDSDILACYMSSQIMLFLQWYFRDFDTPTEVMAKKLLRILHVPMIVPQDPRESK